MTDLPIVRLPDNTYLIVDFKLSRPDEEKIQKYQTQLQSYKFTQEIKGEILMKAYGKGLPSDQVISLSNIGMSIAEAREKGIKSADDQPIWREFAKWYISRN